MSKPKKWEIPHLERGQPLIEGARRILSYRLHSVLQFAALFRRTNDVEDLHQLRIAIRRLRYPLETYLPLLKRKQMIKFLAELNDLQDAAGHARDSDVLMQRLERDRDAHGWRIAKRIFADLKAERIVLYRIAADAIDIFLVSPQLYDFRTDIGYSDFNDIIASEREEREGMHKEFVTATSSENNNEGDPS